MQRFFRFTSREILLDIQILIDFFSAFMRNLGNGLRSSKVITLITYHILRFFK